MYILNIENITLISKDWIIGYVSGTLEFRNCLEFINQVGVMLGLASIVAGCFDQDFNSSMQKARVNLAINFRELALQDTICQEISFIAFTTLEIKFIFPKFFFLIYIKKSYIPFKYLKYILVFNFYLKLIIYSNIQNFRERI